MKKLLLISLVLLSIFACNKRDKNDIEIKILSITPSRGNFNTIVNIKGFGFGLSGGIDSISFNGKRAEIISTTDTSIVTKPSKLSGTGIISIWYKGKKVQGPLFRYDTVAVVSTIAGNGNRGSNNGIGADATFNYPTGIVIDRQGNLFVADSYNLTIRKISSNGSVSTFVGKTGSSGYVDGFYENARFDLIQGLAIDADDNIYASDIFNIRIRKITPNGFVSTIAGNGTFGSDDGPALQASFKQTYGIAVDNSSNDIYIVDIVGNKIRKLSSSGIVTSFAGTGTWGFLDGNASSAMFNQPNGIAVKGSGNLIIVDQGNSRIREIKNGIVSTFAGNGLGGLVDGSSTTARFLSPAHAVVDQAGNVFVTDVGNHAIRKISPGGDVTTIAGGFRGSFDGIGLGASFNAPYGITIDKHGNLYITDQNNHKIRKISFE
ncbi:MAG TPA: IPT/TIG domain-containing protein [Lacibacter sp.]|nr:IPT/TIG domain-containing protein [Lacibacter sp.]